MRKTTQVLEHMEAVIKWRSRYLRLIYYLIVLITVASACSPTAQDKALIKPGLDPGTEQAISRMRAFSLVLEAYACERDYYAANGNFVDDLSVLAQCSPDFKERVELNKAMISLGRAGYDSGGKVCIGSVAEEFLTFYLEDVARGVPEEHGRDTGRRLAVLADDERAGLICPERFSQAWSVSVDGFLKSPCKEENNRSSQRFCTRVWEASASWGEVIEYLFETGQITLSHTIEPRDHTIQVNGTLVSIRRSEDHRAMCFNIEPPASSVSVQVKVIDGLMNPFLLGNAFYRLTSEKVAVYQFRCPTFDMDGWRWFLEVAVADYYLSA